MDPTGRCAFTGGSSGNVRVWDVRCDDAESVDVAAGEPWDAVTVTQEAALLATLESPAGDKAVAATAIALSTDCATMAVGDASGSLSVWERPRGV